MASTRTEAASTTNTSSCTMNRNSKGVHRLVDYVLGAEFDIDQGSTLRHAFPTRVPGMQDQDAFFAEHMLPEGAHNHVDDWTAFFVNRNSVSVTSTHLTPLSKDQANLECLVSFGSVASVDHQMEGDVQQQQRWTAETTDGVDDIFRVSVDVGKYSKLLLTVKYEEQKTLMLWLPEQSGDMRFTTLNHRECSLVVSRDDLSTCLTANTNSRLSASSIESSSATSAFIAIRLCFEEQRFRETFQIELENAFSKQQEYDHELAPPSPLSPPMYFCFNLVSNRPDHTARRGAVVRAICVVSQYPFSQVLKPVLELALESYFAESSLNVLDQLYHSLNAINFRALPHSSPLDNMLLRRQVEARPLSTYNRSVESDAMNSIGGKKLRGKIATSSRGRERHISVATSDKQRYTIRTTVQWPSQTKYNNTLFNETPQATTNTTTVSTTTSATATTLISTTATTATPVAISTTAVSPSATRTTTITPSARTEPSESTPATATHNTSSDHRNESSEVVRVSIDVPLFMEVDRLGGASLELLLIKFGASIMQIYNAVLLERKVLFLSKMAPAGHVTAAVLAAGSLLSPVVQGLTQRCFPYANLNDLSWLEHPGYIAGVTNPVFEGRDSWWDVLCNQDTGAVIASTTLRRKEQQENNSMTGGVQQRSESVSVSMAREKECDNVFISMVIDGARAGFGEDWIRAQFRDLTEEIVSVARGDFMTDATACPCACCTLLRSHVPPSPEALNGALQASAQSCVLGPRVQRWRHTTAFGRLVAEEVFRFRWSRATGRGAWRWPVLLLLHISSSSGGGEDVARRSCMLNVRSAIKRLQTQGVLESRKEIEDLYEELVRHFVKERDLKELLVLLPETLGGLVPLANGLFDPNPGTRQCTCTLLQRLESFDSTRPAVLKLGLFHLSAHNRLQQQQVKRVCTDK